MSNDSNEREMDTNETMSEIPSSSLSSSSPLSPPSSSTTNEMDNEYKDDGMSNLSLPSQKEMNNDSNDNVMDTNAKITDVLSSSLSSSQPEEETNDPDGTKTNSITINHPSTCTSSSFHSSSLSSQPSPNKALLFDQLSSCCNDLFQTPTNQLQNAFQLIITMLQSSQKEQEQLRQDNELVKQSINRHVQQFHCIQQELEQEKKEKEEMRIMIEELKEENEVILEELAEVQNEVKIMSYNLELEESNIEQAKTGFEKALELLQNTKKEEDENVLLSNQSHEEKKDEQDIDHGENLEESDKEEENIMIKSNSDETVSSEEDAEKEKKDEEEEETNILEATNMSTDSDDLNKDTSEDPQESNASTHDEDQGDDAEDNRASFTTTSTYNDALEESISNDDDKQISDVNENENLPNEIVLSNDHQESEPPKEEISYHEHTSDHDSTTSNKSISSNEEENSIPTPDKESVPTTDISNASEEQNQPTSSEHHRELLDVNNNTLHNNKETLKKRWSKVRQSTISHNSNNNNRRSVSICKLEVHQTLAARLARIEKEKDTMREELQRSMDRIEGGHVKALQRITDLELFLDGFDIKSNSVDKDESNIQKSQDDAGVETSSSDEVVHSHDSQDQSEEKATELPSDVDISARDTKNSIPTDSAAIGNDKDEVEEEEVEQDSVTDSQDIQRHDYNEEEDQKSENDDGDGSLNKDDCNDTKDDKDEEDKEDVIEESHRQSIVTVNDDKEMLESTSPHQEAVNEQSNIQQEYLPGRRQSLYTFMIEYERKYKEQLSILTDRINNLDQSLKNRVSRNSMNEKFALLCSAIETNDKEEEIMTSNDTIRGVVADQNALREEIHEINNGMKTTLVSNSVLSNKLQHLSIEEQEQVSSNNNDDNDGSDNEDDRDEDEKVLIQFRKYIQGKFQALEQRAGTMDGPESEHLQISKSLAKLRHDMNECQEFIHRHSMDGVSDGRDMDAIIKHATDAVESHLEQVISTRLADLANVEKELEKMTMQLAEMPNQDQINNMLVDIETSISKKLGEGEMFQTILGHMKSELKHKMTRAEVLVLVKQLFKGAKEDIKRSSDHYSMVGYKPCFRCLGCDKFIPNGVNNKHAPKVNHDALPSSKGLTPSMLHQLKSEMRSGTNSRMFPTVLPVSRYNYQGGGAGANSNAGQSRRRNTFNSLPHRPKSSSLDYRPMQKQMLR